MLCAETGDEPRIPRRLAAVDMTTDKKVWENAYDGQCCERPQISPDGSFMYVGADLKNF
jgi:hypothetical protein